jgi:tetratricopeptide (TPR) repeat protein
VVEGRPNSDLMQDLHWYLEQFLTYPLNPNKQLAERVLAALRGWGEQIFIQLFQGQALLWYDKARHDGLTTLHLKIASDDPRILAWPWEAMSDPQGTSLAQTCCFERQLGELHDPLPLSVELTRDRINILLIIARPSGDRDVGYHAISRSMVELSRSERLPVYIDVLRPPTFTQLRQVLHEKPGFYHIVHFDGHSGYGGADHVGSPYSFEAPQGCLIFEDEQGEGFPVGADKLSELLTEYRIPIMVLNTCQSAPIDECPQDAFASIAATLLKSGVRSVVVMGYNLDLSGSQQFIPAFYQRLIESGQIAEAVRAGRQAMQEQDARVCVRGAFPLQDWLVPVLYQQEPIVLPAFKETHALPMEVPVPSSQLLPEEARELSDYGFIGRERAIQSLERARLRQKQAAVLVHGMLGVGKTTLARGFLHWLHDTHGLGAGVFWFAFDAIHSAEHVINRLLEGLFNSRTRALPLEKKLETLIAPLREQPFLIIWDNFESAAGIPGTEVSPLLPEEDRQWLKTLLQQLRGGRTKILIASRSPENWLSPTECYRLPLGGLIGEQRWAYCNAVVRDLGLCIDWEDASFMELIQLLNGHPLAMRAVLLRLQELPAQALLEEWQSGFESAVGDKSARRVFTALSLLVEGLPTAYAPLLQLIGLHQRTVQLDVLEAICQVAETPVEKSTLNGCVTALEIGGQLNHRGQGVYAMHPALSGFLHQYHPASETLQRSFVDVMGFMAEQLTPRPLHGQSLPFILHGVNFYSALSLAGECRMDDPMAVLTQSLAAFALNNRDFATAMQLFASRAEHEASIGDQEGVASAYHQLGRVAQKQRDFATAAQWYQKSLDIKEKLGNEHGAANTYHQLGRIAKEQSDSRAAGQWYQKAITGFSQTDDQHYLGIALSNYARNLHTTDEYSRAELRERWYAAGLDKLISFDELEKPLNEWTNITG